MARAPALDRVLDNWLDLLAGAILVAHAAWVEQGFLERALVENGVSWRGRSLDTMRLGQAWLRRAGQPAPQFMALGDLAGRLGLPVHRPHHADGDALTTAQVFVALASHLEGAGARRVGDLSREARRGRGRWFNRRGA